MNKTTHPHRYSQQCIVLEDGERCERLVGAKGAKKMCPKHYKRFKAHGDPLVLLIKPPDGVTVCAYDKGCSELAEIKQWCYKHHKTMWAREHPESRSVYDPVASKKWRDKQTPEQKAASNHRSVLRHHHVTQEWWDATWAAQGEQCGTGCGAIEPGGLCSWIIDHDHGHCPGKASCGECVRGLICHGCNAGMGQMGDDAARLRLCADYLDSHDARIRS